MAENIENNDILEEEEEDILVLTDEDGNETPFDLIDILEYNSNEYVVLIPHDEEEGDTGEVVILQIEETGDDTETFITVESDDDLAAVFDMFKRKYEDIFDFVD